MSCEPKSKSPFVTYIPPDWLKHTPHKPDNDYSSNDKPDQIYSAIGKVTATWERCEGINALLFQNLCGTKNPASMRGYGAIIGSGSRADMILEAASISLQNDKQRLAFIVAQMKWFRRLGSLRNSIAHGEIYTAENPTNLVSFDVQMKEPKNCFLGPPFYNSSKTVAIGAPKYLYVSSTILTIMEEFRKWQVSMLSALTGPDQPIADASRWRVSITMNPITDSDT